jgi:Protein of unknown function (DUF3298)
MSRSAHHRKGNAALPNGRLLGQAVVSARLLVGWFGTATAAAQSACADLGGTVDTDQICHVHSATASYTLDFSFPVDYPDQQAVTDYLTHERDQFISFAAQIPPGPERFGEGYELTETAKTYRSGTPATGTESLMLQIANNTGLAHVGHPATHFTAFNYDLAKHTPITFDTLFKPGTKPLDVINPAYRAALQKRWGSQTLPQPDGGLDVNAYQNFAITDDAVIFFFGDGQVGEVGGSPLEVPVPHTELAALLA